jgi:hypothetical protein
MGLELARLLHQSGAEVYLLDLDGAEAVAAELGVRWIRR